MQVLLHTGETKVTESLVALNAAELSFEDVRAVGDRELTTRRHHFEVVGARPGDDSNVEITVRFNLATLGMQYEDGRNKWAKGHFSITPDMSGCAALAKYAERTIGRQFRGGALQYEAGSGLNYALMPSLADGGYVTFDVEFAGNVTIDGVESEQYVIADLWFEGCQFAAPIGELEVQRPVKRQNPLASAPAPILASAPVRKPVSVPAALLK